MEVRSKAAPIEVSSAFWLIGNHFEIDVFEMIGTAVDGPDGSGPGVSRTMPVTLHNWDLGNLDENGYGESYELGWEVGAGFHTYGAHWTDAGVTFYADGEEVGQITREEAAVFGTTTTCMCG